MNMQQRGKLGGMGQRLRSLRRQRAEARAMVIMAKERVKEIDAQIVELARDMNRYREEIGWSSK